MLIPCVRCGKLIESPNAANAKYIMNHSDKRTWGKDKVGRFRSINPKTGDLNKPHKHFEDAITEMKKWRAIRTKKIALEKSENIKTELEEQQKGEAVEEIIVEEERPKTAIVCFDCLQSDDTIIW